MLPNNNKTLYNLFSSSWLNEGFATFMAYYGEEHTSLTADVWQGVLEQSHNILRQGKKQPLFLSTLLINWPRLSMLQDYFKPLKNFIG